MIPSQSFNAVHSKWNLAAFANNISIINHILAVSTVILADSLDNLAEIHDFLVI
jgi:hypothetical protein